VRDDATVRRQLIIVRHAKSSWDDPHLDDHDRPLAPRGRKALPRLAEHLAALEVGPDLVLCSSARRTRHTLAGVRAALPAKAEVLIDEALYHAGPHWYVGQLRSLGDEIRCAMVVGHNPGLQELAVLLVGDGDAVLRAQLELKFPTAAAATISFEGGWGDLGPGARLDDLFLPRRPRP
jgi:phosphohistidine phosphatase